MKFNVLQSVAAALSMGLCTIASAQYGPAPQGSYSYGNSYSQPGQYSQQQQYSQPGQYSPQQYQQGPASQLGVPRTESVQTFGGTNYQGPSKWNNFGKPNNGPQLFQPASTGSYDNNLPIPEQIPTPQPNNRGGYQQPQPQPQPQPQYSAPPIQQAAPQLAPQIQPYSGGGAPTHAGAPVNDAYGESRNQAPMQSPFAAAASQPWEGDSCAIQSCGMPAQRPELFPWFGSFNLLFFSLENNGKDRNLISKYDTVGMPSRGFQPQVGLSQLSPRSELGYELNFGRYFGCGQYGLGVGYFNWNPDEEVVDQTYMAQDHHAMPLGDGAIRASGMPQYHGARMNYMFDNGVGGGGYRGLDFNGGGYDAATDYATIYDIIDGSAGNASRAIDGNASVDGVIGSESHAEAVRFRARRDIDIQGIEFNLFHFGLMGAQRAAMMNCGDGGHGFGGLSSMFGGGYGGIGGYGGYGGYGGGHHQHGDSCGPRHGFGGAGGPLVRPCTGKLQVITSHGFRWFQYDDSIDYAFDVDGRAGFTMNDIYDTTRTKNNLYGYQFGSQLVYCLGSRVNLLAGSKFGLYGNRAEFRHRLGSHEKTAELAAMPGSFIDYNTKDTVLSTLGEIDLGLGYRVTNCWSVTGGYRVMGVTGLASAANYSRDYSSVASASALHADTSLLLHGAYVGSMFNF